MKASGPSLQLLRCPRLVQVGMKWQLRPRLRSWRLPRFASRPPGCHPRTRYCSERHIGLVARNRARRLLRHDSPDHVAHARAPEVVEEHAGDAGRFGEIVPCYAEVFDYLTVL